MKFSVRRFVLLLLLGVLLAVMGLAYNSTTESRITRSEPHKDCRVVQHATGTACIPYHPKRVITLWMGTFRSTLALGIKPIASTWLPGEPFPTHLQDKVQSAENLGLEPNLERILVLKPDLILSNTRLQTIYPQLSNIAPTVVLEHPRPPAPWQKTLTNVAKILDKEQENKQLVNDYWQRIENLKQTLGDRRLKMRVSVATVSPSYGIYVYGKQHPTGIVLNDLGLQRPRSQSGDFFTLSNISQENLPEIDGDVIFLSSSEGNAGREALEKLQQHPLWRTLKAVQQNRVYLVDSDHWYAFDVLAMNAVLDDLEKYLVNTQ